MASYNDYDRELLDSVQKEIVFLSWTIHNQGRQDVSRILFETARLFGKHFCVFDDPNVPDEEEHTSLDDLTADALDLAHAEMWLRATDWHDRGDYAGYRLLMEVVRLFELHYGVGPQTGFRDNSVSSADGGNNLSSSAV